MGSVAEKFLTDPFFLVDPGQICFYIFSKLKGFPIIYMNFLH